MIFGKKNKFIKDKFTICYPYGSYNSDTLSILSEYKCSTGLTTKVGSVPDNEYLALELPRFDTNDFPQNLNEVNKKGWGKVMAACKMNNTTQIS